MQLRIRVFVIPPVVAHPALITSGKDKSSLTFDGVVSYIATQLVINEAFYQHVWGVL
jgi:hypothetical protein